MSADMDNTDKVVGLIEDARRQGLEVNAPDINVFSARRIVDGSNAMHDKSA